MKTKKVLCGVLLGCSVLMLVGCGKKTESSTSTSSNAKTQTISCLSSQGDESISYNFTYNFVYDNTNKVVTSGNFVSVLTYPSADAEDYENLDFCKDYEDASGVLSSCSFEKGENSITTTYGLNLDNLATSTAGEEDGKQFKTTFTADEVKAWAEKSEYGTCTIK